MSFPVAPSSPSAADTQSTTSPRDTHTTRTLRSYLPATTSTKGKTTSWTPPRQSSRLLIPNSATPADLLPLKATSVTSPLTPSGSRPMPARNVVLSRLESAKAEREGRLQEKQSKRRSHVYILREKSRIILDTIDSLVTSQSYRSSGSTVYHKAKGLRDLYQNLFNTLATIASNHGSDWIEHARGGGISYAEYHHLDIDDLRRRTEQLHTLGHDLSMHPRNTEEYVERVLESLRLQAEKLLHKLTPVRP